MRPFFIEKILIRRKNGRSIIFCILLFQNIRKLLNFLVVLCFEQKYIKKKRSSKYGVDFVFEFKHTKMTRVRSGGPFTLSF